MSAKHTPGPWTIHTGEDGTLYVNQERPLSRIATIAKGRGDAADARLVAAAPELLDICESILAEVEYEGLQLESGRIAKLRAAIAKATGENPNN